MHGSEDRRVMQCEQLLCRYDLLKSEALRHCMAILDTCKLRLHSLVMNDHVGHTLCAADYCYRRHSVSHAVPVPCHYNTGEPCRGTAVSVHTIWNVLQHLVNQTKFNIASAPTHRAAHYFFRIRVHSHYDMSSIRCSRSVSCCRLFWLIFAKACALMNTVGSIGVASVVQTGILTTIYCLLCLCLAVHHIVHFRRPLVLILRFCDSVSLILELQVFHPRDLSEFGWKFCRVVPCFVYVNASAVFDFLA